MQSVFHPENARLRAPLALLIGACVILAGGVSAQSITTPPNFAANNGGSAGGAVYFDVTIISGGGLILESFDCNTNLAAGSPLAIDVYTCPLTSIGNELIMANWTLQGSGTGTSLGAGVGTPVDTTDFVMTAGTYGMAIVNFAGHAYTNGTGANQTVATGEMSLSLGTASNVAFVGGLFTPRVWNGTIHYAPNANILDVQQDMSLNLTATLSMLGANSYEGITFLSNNTSLPIGQGPFLGMTPDALTWSCFGNPYAPSDPFHFRVTDPAWPTTPLNLPGIIFAGLTGQTMDIMILFMDTSFAYDSSSNIVRYTFQ